MTTLFEMFENIETQWYDDVCKNLIYILYRIGYCIISCMSQIEILFINSAVNKEFSALFNSITPKHTFKFIKDGKLIQTQYESYSYYLDDSKFDFIIFSNGKNNRIITNINQHLVFKKDPLDILITPVLNQLWFSSTLHYSGEDDTVHSVPIEFNTQTYNYLLSENIFDNLFIEYFIQTYYNINLQNTMYSICILNMNFNIDTYNRNKLITLQHILKKEM